MKAVLAICVAATIGVLATGCAKPKAVTSTMTEEQKTALRASLSGLEDTLGDKSPFVYDKLAPAATDEELERLQAELGGVRIECLEVWYGWHNGCEEYLANVLPLGRMLSITEALEDRKMIQSIPFVEVKRKSALKILDDGAGDGFFLDIASANPRVFYDMLEDPGPTDFGTLQEFVSFIAEVHAAGIASENEHGAVVFDLRRYEEIEAEYLKRIGTPRYSNLRLSSHSFAAYGKVLDSGTPVERF